MGGLRVVVTVEDEATMICIRRSAADCVIISTMMQTLESLIRPSGDKPGSKTRHYKDGALLSYQREPLPLHSRTWGRKEARDLPRALKRSEPDEDRRTVEQWQESG